MNAHFIDPVIFNLGPLQIRWYGLMYVIGFALGTLLLRKLVDQGFLHVVKKEVDNFITYTIFGVFLGARIFYVFIYNWDYYKNNLGDILAVWKGGLSYHGAITGMIVALYLFAKKNKISFLQVLDSAVLAGSIGVFFGRLGNFINGELYGRITDVPWGMVFKDGGPYPRHPSQLYEAFGEGVLVFIVLWMIKPKLKHHGLLFSIYFILYGVARFTVEYFREADVQLGYYFGNSMTMGQILCIGMILFGIGSFILCRKKSDPIIYRPTEQAG